MVGLRDDKLWTPAKIVDQILNGGQKMSAFRESLSDEEAAELAAYLRARTDPSHPLPRRGESINSLAWRLPCMKRVRR